MNLVLGMMYHTYKDRTVEDNELYRARTLCALSKAFALLDPLNTGQISLETFRRLMMYLKPSVSREEVEILFKVVDYDGNKAISRGQFTHLVPFLKFRYKRTAVAKDEEKHRNPFERFRARLRAFLDIKAVDTCGVCFRAVARAQAQVKRACVPASARSRPSAAGFSEPTSLSDMFFDFLVMVNTVLLIVQVSASDCDAACEDEWATVHVWFLVAYCA